MNIINYTNGQIIGDYGIIYLNEEPRITAPYRCKVRIASFLCHCGKIYITRLCDVRCNKSKSCGCGKGVGLKEHKEGDILNNVEFKRSLGSRNKAQVGIFICPICSKEWVSLIANVVNGNSKSCCNKVSGWTKKGWTSRYDFASLYKVRLYNDTESFIKIGMTTVGVKNRMISVPYSYEILKIINGDSGYIFDLEKRINKIYSMSKYKPIIKFKGDTECFNTYTNGHLEM